MNWIVETLGLDISWSNYLAVAVRAAIVFLCVLVIVRVGARRLIARMSSVDVVIVITIGSIGSRAVTGNAPFGASMLGIAALVFLHWLSSFVSFKSGRASKWLKGQPVPLVKKGQPIEGNLRRSKITEGDFEEALRANGVSGDVDRVWEAWMERDGSISIVAKK